MLSKLDESLLAEDDEWVQNFKFLLRKSELSPVLDAVEVSKYLLARRGLWKGREETESWVLAALEASKTFTPYVIKQPVEVDSGSKWRWLSGMQKGIRFGLYPRAIKSAMCLNREHSTHLWRRLGLIAVEDIGVANLPLVAMVLTVSGRRVFRKRLGEERLLSFLIYHMCRSVKNRDVTELLCWVGHTRDRWDRRLDMMRMKLGPLQAIALDPLESVDDRMWALWLIAGTSRYRAPNGLSVVKTMTRDLFWETVEEFDLPILAQYVMRLASTKSNDGMFIAIPLMCEMMRSDSPLRIREKKTSTEMCGEILSAGYDQYTWQGKRALAYFKKACAPVREFFEENGGDNAVEALGLAVFEAEGGVLDKRLVLNGTDDIYHHAIEAYFENAGWPAEKGWGLIELVSYNIDVLHKSRRRVTGND